MDDIPDFGDDGGDPPPRGAVIVFLVVLGLVVACGIGVCVWKAGLDCRDHVKAVLERRREQGLYEPLGDGGESGTAVTVM